MGIEDYHVIGLVGEGSFGKVYKGRRKYTRQVGSARLVSLAVFSDDFGYSYTPHQRPHEPTRCDLGHRQLLTVHVIYLILIQTVAMKFILKHGKTDKDLHNLRQEIEVTNCCCLFIYLHVKIGYVCHVNEGLCVGVGDGLHCGRETLSPKQMG